jgi:hypothetical protein
MQVYIETVKKRRASISKNAHKTNKMNKLARRKPTFGFDFADRPDKLHQHVNYMSTKISRKCELLTVADGNTKFPEVHA